MIAVYLFLSSLLRILRHGFKDPEFRGLFYSVFVLLIIGTIFYNRVEGWSLLDSFYFTVVALTTVGFGDFSPETTVGKLFTVVYLIIGLGLLSSFIIQLAQIRRSRKTTILGGTRTRLKSFQQKDDSTAESQDEDENDQ